MNLVCEEMQRTRHKKVPGRRRGAKWCTQHVAVSTERRKKKEKEWEKKNRGLEGGSVAVA